MVLESDVAARDFNLNEVNTTQLDIQNSEATAIPNLSEIFPSQKDCNRFVRDLNQEIISTTKPAKHLGSKNKANVTLNIGTKLSSKQSASVESLKKYLTETFGDSISTKYKKKSGGLEIKIKEGERLNLLLKLVEIAVQPNSLKQEKK